MDKNESLKREILSKMSVRERAPSSSLIASI
jgi:hypothetical protein